VIHPQDHFAEKAEANQLDADQRERLYFDWPPVRRRLITADQPLPTESLPTGYRRMRGAFRVIPGLLN
jgi:hypothetical protein